MHSVLITGGTGFFGRHFVRRLLAGSVQRICIYSRDEFKQARMREAFPDQRMRFFIGDVRDQGRLTRAMEGCDVVVHAAALKRIEVGTYNPGEMVKTNVTGTINTIEAAHDAGVERVVYLSSDKAYEPVSPYGQTKALAESLVLAANSATGRHGPKFAVTRYGNVAGSTGSVIPTWKSRLADGLPINVTDPDCTRFWMTIDEAIDLVLDTAFHMPLKAAIPTLPAFRVGDLLAAMDVGVFTVTGLPWYEKKHESMDATHCSADAQRLTLDELRERLAPL